MSDSELVSTKDLHSATITVRIIKSFEYRTIKNHVFQKIDLTKTTAADLLELVKQVVQTQGAFRPYRTTDLNALKIYTHAHTTKTMNLAINLDHDDWMLTDPAKPLADYGIKNESELSCFNSQQYEAFKSNPVEKWD